ncbi:MAG: MaoC family dehydratase [Paracoccaceae bacterium]
MIQTAASLTSQDNYYEDFVEGDVWRHARGKTMTEMDNVLLTNLVLNTAEGHFNEDRMQKSGGGIFSQRVVFGGINLSFIIGLAAQDTGEQVIAELAMDKVRLRHPVFHGDTLYAFTEVLEKTESDRADAGRIRFRHYGINQNEEMCVEAERLVLIKKRAFWSKGSK